MAYGIVNITELKQGGSQTNQYDSTLVSSPTAGNTILVIASCAYQLTGIAGIGASPTFNAHRAATVYNSAQWCHVWTVYNVSASLTGIRFTYSGYASVLGYAIELSGMPTTEDPWLADSVYANSYNATTCGIGTVTPSAAGVVFAYLSDAYGNGTAETLDAADGWSQDKTYGANKSVLGHQSSSASTAYGSSSADQATGTKTGEVGYSGVIVALKEDAGGFAVVSGTEIAGITETDRVTGGKVLTITLTGETFIA